ncbi:MAG: glycosyltransferase [Verrucomicrobia bacterium]|nr:glycosyltransferase [Verrucomicrobiota bacterium]
MNERASPGVRFWLRFACLGVSVVALWLIFRRLDFQALVEAMLRIRFGWFAAAIIVFGVAFVLAAIRWHLVLRLSQCHVHFGATVRTVFVGHFFNTLLFGPPGGDVAKAALYARWFNHPVSSILATCFLDRLLGGIGFLLFLVAIPGFSLGAERSLPSHVPAISGSRWVMLGGLLLILPLVGLGLRRTLLSWMPLKRLAQTFHAGLGQLARQPRQAFVGVLTSFLAHVCMSSLLLLCLNAVTEQSFSLKALIWTFPAISLISAPPITFAGTGLREGAAMVLFGRYGIPAADAVAASLLVLVIYLAWAAITGILFWREQRLERGRSKVTPRSLSVVIPTLNEATSLPETIASLRKVREVSEIIVVDGGSSDNTTNIALQLGCHVLTTARGRGRQLREGALKATGDVVLLLHADTLVPSGAGSAALNCLRDPTVIGGGFWKVFRTRSFLMLGSRFRCAVRLYLGGRIAGDQAMFIRRDVLEAIGGVPDMPLMEEFELCRRLRIHGRLALAGAIVSTSARRFAKLGVIRTYLRMCRVTVQYYCGTPVQKLAKLYERD